MDLNENFEYVKCNLCDSDSSLILFNIKDILHKKKGFVYSCKM